MTRRLWAHLRTPLRTAAERGLTLGSKGRSKLPVPGEAEMSAKLRAFIDESPHERRSIAAFVARAAQETPAGARVLDAGAGDAPYAELFRHCEYMTSDWAGSLHEGARNADVVAPLDDLPLDDGSFDAILNTQVLEHLPDPSGALAELRRVLLPGGRLWLTAPLVWPLHEEPYDYFRYTSHGLRALLEGAGFEDIEIEPRTGYFATMATLLANCPGIIGQRRDAHSFRRVVVSFRLWRLALRLERLEELDVRRALPLGYQCRAVRPPER